jgi:hypothetical protein
MKQALILLSVLLLSRTLVAQGCSDAGFCTIGGLGHQQGSGPQQHRSLRLLLTTGVGDESVTVFTPAIEYTHVIKRWQLQGRLTANYASGALASVFGPGDLFLSATYALPSKSALKPSFTLGTKLPLNGGNLKAEGRSLPLQYQSSLGTVDLITGVSLLSERWNLAAGWQQPLTGINRNNFLPAYWPSGKADAFPPGNDFNRKGDVLLRGAYRYRLGRARMESGLLAIYHLGKDTYVDANQSLLPISIRGSEGLTLNLTSSLELPLGPRWTVGISGGVPLVVRDVRPDGLTRRFAIAPSATFHF